MMDHFTLIFGSIFAFIGLIFLVIGLIFRSKEHEKSRRCTGRTIGQVVSIAQRTSHDSDYGTSITYSPVVSYWVNGIEMRQTNSVYSSPNHYDVGQTVNIYYDPLEPSRMIIEGDKSSRILYGVFIGMGALFFIIGLAAAAAGIVKRV